MTKEKTYKNSDDDFSPPKGFIDIKKASFKEMLRATAEDSKETLVFTILEAAQRGEPGALKLITQALLDSQDVEDNVPISDERIKQIITLAADAVSKGIV